MRPNLLLYSGMSLNIQSNYSSNTCLNYFEFSRLLRQVAVNISYRLSMLVHDHDLRNLRQRGLCWAPESLSLDTPPCAKAVLGHTAVCEGPSAARSNVSGKIIDMLGYGAPSPPSPWPWSKGYSNWKVQIPKSHGRHKLKAPR